MIQHKILYHARDMDDKIFYPGDYVTYTDFDDIEHTVRVEKIVHNYGGAVLLLNNEDRVIAANVKVATHVGC